MRRATFVTFAIIALLAAACGQGPALGERVAQAAERSVEQGTAKVSMEMTMDLPPEAGGGRITAHAEGQVDIDEQLSRMTMTFSGQGEAQAASEQMGEIEAVSKGLVVYMRLPMIQEVAPEAKEWIRMDIEEIGRDMGVDMGPLMQLGQGDPAQQLHFLHGVEDAEELGSEDVRGADTTHLRGSIDLANPSGDIPEDARSSLQSVGELTGVEKIPFEAWIDGDELVRRMAMTFDYSNAPDSDIAAIGTIEMAMEYFDYGTEVDVEIPPDEDVMDIEELENLQPQ